MTKKRMKAKNLKKLRGLDPEATSASVIIDAHYARLGLKKKWNKQRVDRLCSYLRMTYPELASLLHMDKSAFRVQLKSMRPFSGPVCILLSILEHKFMSDFAPDTISDIFKFTENDQS